jgi:hypothetical protein
MFRGEAERGGELAAEGFDGGLHVRSRLAEGALMARGKHKRPPSGGPELMRAQP